MSAEFDGIAWAARETALRQCVGHIRPATATASASGEDQEVGADAPNQPQEPQTSSNPLPEK